MIRSFLGLLLVASTMAQTPSPTAPAKGSISGVARDVNTGAPVAKVEISASNPPMRPVITVSDEQGRFTLRDVDPGRIQLSGRAAPTQGAGFGVLSRKFVNLLAGQNLTSIDFSVQTNAQVSGTVRDQNDEPVPGVSVTLIAREYQLGQVHYVFTGGGTTDDQGKYVITRAEPGVAYLLLVKRALRVSGPISDAPADTQFRRPSVIPTYYPGVETVAGAQTITLRSGEQRENVDIRLRKSPSYCMEGVVPGTGQNAFRFNIVEASPHSGTSGSGGSYVGEPGGKIGPDGKLRLCDLHPDSYRITIRSEPEPGVFKPPQFFSTGIHTVSDRDGGITIAPLPKIQMKGELVWAQSPLDGFTFPANWVPQLQAFTRTSNSEGSFPRPPAMGSFDLDNLFLDEYRLILPPNPLGGNVYLKAVTYGDSDLLREPFRPGTQAGDQRLRVILAHDGGKVKATVVDREGKTLSDQHVIILPKAIRSEAELADIAISGQTDQNGEWTSGAMAPGRYYVLASRTPFDRTPETIGRLWAGRDKGKELDVAPGATADAAVSIQ